MAAVARIRRAASLVLEVTDIRRLHAGRRLPADGYTGSGPLRGAIRKVRSDHVFHRDAHGFVNRRLRFIETSSRRIIHNVAERRRAG
jgi:hypothetical protein